MAITLDGTNGIDLDGKELKLDADADTSLTADTDDQIDIKIAGSDIGIITGTIGLIIGTGDTGLGFQTSTGDAIIPQRPDTKAAVNNQLSLGNSSYAFKDMYLGGNLYIGGTGSANALDDYEEGTWTPTLYNGSSNLGSNNINATYTKIGRTVYAEFQIGRNDSASDTNLIQIGGLPFASRAGPRMAGQAWIDNSGTDIKCFIYIGSSVTTASLIKVGDNNSFPSYNEFENGRFIYAAVLYNT